MTKFIKKWPGRVQDGILKLNDSEGFKKECALYEGKQVVLTLDRWKNPRSNDQNRYYWGVVLKMMADETGNTPEEVHDLMRGEFLPGTRITMKLAKDSLVTKVRTSTSDLDTIAFTEYIEKIRQFAARELGLNIPDPTSAYKTISY